VRDFQSIIGKEVRWQLAEQEGEGRLPDVVVAAIGGGSNAMGLFFPFLDDPSVRIVGVEAGGKGVDDRMEHCASLTGGRPGVLGTRVFQSRRAVLMQEFVDLRLNDVTRMASPPPGWSELVPAEGERAPMVGSPGHAWMLDRGVTTLLAALRAAHPAAFLVDSGFRNPRRNAEVHGRLDSPHLSGRAADVTAGEAGASGAEARLALYRAAAGLRVRGRSRALLEDRTRGLAPLNVVPVSIDATCEERVRIERATQTADDAVELVVTREKPIADRTATLSPLMAGSVLYGPTDDRAGAGRSVSVSADDRGTVSLARDEVISRGQIWLVRTPWRALLARATHIHISV